VTRPASTQPADFLCLVSPEPRVRVPRPATLTASGRNPYSITGPAHLGISGGRTSAYMLARILDAHGGHLPPNVHPVFANTGEEDPRTLTFVAQLAERWGVNLTWIERDPDATHGYREVSYETASRKGEPFRDMVTRKGCLPNGRPGGRHCTHDLKIMAMAGFMEAQGYGDEWVNVVGLRWDEPDRVAKTRARESDWDVLTPLYDARATKRTVMDFWKAQDFDLTTPAHLGNCQACFLKGRAIRDHVVRDAPEAAARFAALEALTGHRFVGDEPGGYAAQIDRVRRTPLLPILQDAGPALPCDCTQRRAPPLRLRPPCTCGSRRGTGHALGCDRVFGQHETPGVIYAPAPLREAA